MKHLLAFALMVGTASNLCGAPVLQIAPQEVVVSPGDTAQFEVRLTGATHLAGFYIELGIAPGVGAAGSVEFLGASGDTDPEYCFYGFNDIFQNLVLGGIELAAGDQTNPPQIEVTTVPEVNDLLAIVEVNTSPDGWGAFNVTFDDVVLELFDQYGHDIPEFGQTVTQGATIIVPEPTTAFFLLAIGAAFAASRRMSARH